MTPNERKIMDTLIKMIRVLGAYDGDAAVALHDPLVAIQSALDADPAPRECDPYAASQASRAFTQYHQDGSYDPPRYDVGTPITPEFPETVSKSLFRIVPCDIIPEASK